MKKNQLIELIKKYKLKLPDEIPEFKTNSNKNNVIKKMSDKEQNEYVTNQLKYNAVISNNGIWISRNHSTLYSFSGCPPDHEPKRSGKSGHQDN